MTSTAKMTEEQMVTLVRNALIVAGMEMGAEGDHWPVIKSTINDIMKDWEDLKTERDVCAEVKKHYEKMIGDLQSLANQASPTMKTDIETTIAEIRQITHACFARVNDNDLYFSDEQVPPHVKRAEAIINTLGGHDDV